jgi:putative transposase
MTRCTRWLRSLLSCACLFFTLVCDAGRFLLLCLHPRPTLAAEKRFLRKQLALYQERHVKLRRATNATRLAWVWLGCWCDWRQALAVVHPTPSSGEGSLTLADACRERGELYYGPCC